MENEEKLTPTQIASMSEVVAKYMGYKIDNSFFEDIILIETDKGWYQTDYEESWQSLHDVWEKVREEEEINKSLPTHLFTKITVNFL